MTAPAEHYDQIAAGYDDLYQSPADRDEEYYLLGRVGIRGRVLDIGAGTGLLLRRLAIPKTHYVGVEPAPGMADVFERNHPGYQLYRGTMSGPSFAPDGEPEPADRWIGYAGPFDTVVALFGVASYLSEQDIRIARSLLAPGGRAVLMWYGHNYRPRSWPPGGLVTYSPPNFMPYPLESWDNRYLIGTLGASGPPTNRPCWPRRAAP